MSYATVVATDSPAVWLRMQETSGTACADETGTIADGAYSGVTVNQQGLLLGEHDALSVLFDAADTVTFTGATISEEFEGASAISFEAWVMRDQVPAGASPIVALNIGNSVDGFAVEFDASDNIKVTARVVYTDVASDITYALPSATNEQALHVVAVADFRLSILTLYINGEQVATEPEVLLTGTYANHTSHANDDVLGKFDGNLADFSFYSTALSPLQIRQHYRAGAEANYQLSLLGHRKELLSHFWPLDYNEYDWGTDRTTGQRNGTVTGSPTTEQDGLTNFTGLSYLFDGTSDYISMASGTGVGAGLPRLVGCLFSISDTTSTARPLISYGADTALNLFELYLTTTGFIELDLNSITITVTSGSDLRDGEAHTVAVELDNGSAETDIVIYVDGILATISVSGTGTINTTAATSFYVGTDVATTGLFKGYISNVFSFAYTSTEAPTEDEHRSLYKDAVQPRYGRGYDKFIMNLSPDFYMDLGEHQGGVLMDRTANANDGVLEGGASMGEVGGLLNDDAASVTFFVPADFITVTDASAMQSSDDTYVCFWFRCSNYVEDVILIEKTNCWRLAFASSGSVLRMSVFFSGVEYTYDLSITADSLWHFVKCYRTGATMGITYDEMIGSDNAAAITGPSSVAGDLIIGKFTGAIMKVMLFSADVDNAAAKGMYEAGRSRMAAEMLSKTPNAYLRLNEPSGTIAYDMSSYGLNGVHNSSPSLGNTSTPVTNETGHVTTKYNDDSSTYIADNARFSVDLDQMTVISFMTFTDVLGGTSEQFMSHWNVSSQRSWMGEITKTASALAIDIRMSRDGGITNSVNYEADVDLFSIAADLSDWHSYAFRRNPTTDKGEIVFDGQDWPVIGAALGGLLHNSTGTVHTASYSGNVSSLKGYMSEFAFFDQYLSNEEIVDVIEMASYVDPFVARSLTTSSFLSGTYDLPLFISLYGHMTGAFDIAALTSLYGAMQAEHSILAFKLESGLFSGGVYDLLAYQVKTGYAAGEYDLNRYLDSVGHVQSAHGLNAFIVKNRTLQGTYILLNWVSQYSDLFSEYDIARYASVLGHLQSESDFNAYASEIGSVDGSYDLHGWVARQMSLNGDYDLLAYRIFTGWVNSEFDLLSFQLQEGYVSGSYDQTVYAYYTSWMAGEYNIERWLQKGGALDGAYDLKAFQLLSGYLNTEYNLSALEAIIGFVEAAYHLDAAEIFYGSFTNLDTGAFARFENYNFNSFAGNMGANENGIYTLAGDDDAGVFIDTVVETGTVDFETSYLKRVTDAYLGMTSDGCLKLTITTDNGVFQYVISDFGDIGTKKKNLARGAKGRYWKYRIDNIDGSKIDMDSLELIAHVMKRRVR